MENSGKCMNNKIASKLFVFGNVYLIISIIAGIITMFMPTETLLPLTGRVISEWNPITLVYGSVVIVSGIVISLILKGFAEIVENTYTSRLYQQELLKELKK